VIFLKKTKKLYLIIGIIFLFSINYLIAQDLYTWADKRNFPIFFELPQAAGVNEVTLTVTTSTAPDNFLLIYPDPEDGFEVLKPGYAFDTLPDTNSGEHVTFGTVSGDYVLKVSKNPSTTGTFTERKMWGLVVIHSTDISSIAATVSSPATLLDNGDYWYNKIEVPFVFTIPADIAAIADETDDITRVTLTVKTEINDPTFILTFPDAVVAGTDQVTYYYSDITAGVDENYPSTNAGYHVIINESPAGSETFILQISRNHFLGEFIATFGLGTPPTQTDEVFSLTIKKPPAIPVNDPVDPITTVSITSETPNGGTPASIPSDPVKLNYAPFVAIDEPGNLPYTNPYPIMQNRIYGYSSEIHDETTAVPDLTKNWYLDGGPSFSTNVDPVTTNSFTNIGTHEVEVTVSEDVPRPGTLTDITQESKDKLQLEIIQAETALFPPHRGVPGDTNPPDIDGIISTDFNDYNNRLGDRGWNEAFRVTFQGGTHPEMAFQGNSNSSSSQGFLYCSFEVTNDETFDEYDTVILGFSADQNPITPADDRLILIHPFPASPPSGENLDPAEIKVWSQADGWIDSSIPNFPNNIVAKIKNSELPLSNSWNLEIQIPTSTDGSSGGSNWIDINNDFLFYFNVYRVNTNEAPNQVTEFHFPRKSPDIIGDVEAYPYNPVWWAHDWIT